MLAACCFLVLMYSSVDGFQKKEVMAEKAALKILHDVL